jgi:hypothetical protein
MNDESLAPGICVHRIGGGNVENLRLKSKEMALSPPGISVLLAASAEEVRLQVRRAFPLATRLLEAAETIGSTTVEHIHDAGFDIIADPTRHFSNHARIVHRDGVRGFRDANLRGLSRAFTNTTRS